MLYANRTRLAKIYNEVGDELPIEMLNLASMIRDHDDQLNITPEIID